MEIDIATRRDEDADQGRAHRRSRLQPSRPLAVGPAASERLRRRWCGWMRPTTNGPRFTRGPTARCPSTSTFRPTAQLISMSVARDQRRRRPCSVFGSPTWTGDKPKEIRDLQLRRGGARGVRRSRRTGAISTAARITPASRTSIASISRPARSKPSSNAETGFFRPIPRDDGSLIVLRVHGPRFHAGRNRSETARRSGRHQVPRQRGRRPSIRS